MKMNCSFSKKKKKYYPNVFDKFNKDSDFQSVSYLLFRNQRCYYTLNIHVIYIFLYLYIPQERI